jgi:hypothetical protein
MKVFCNLTREQAALYEAIVNEMLSQIDNSGGIQRRGLILAALTKLKQICNHPAHFLADGSAIPHRSGKCDRLREMLEEVLAEGDRALVFTQFRQWGHLLERFPAGVAGSRDPLPARRDEREGTQRPGRALPIRRGRHAGIPPVPQGGRPWA